MKDIFSLFCIHLFYIILVKTSVILKVLPTDMVEKTNEKMNITLPSFFEPVRIKEDLFNFNGSVAYHFSFRGYGAFLNISYSTVFLKISLDQSLLYLSLYKSENIEANEFNLSNYKFNFYSAGDDNCWLYLSDNVDLCASDFYFKNRNQKFFGYLGHDFGFFEKRFVNLQNLVYLKDGMENYTNEKFNNIHGILGLGYSENEGVYGNSLLEELVERSIIFKYNFGICINKIDSFVIIGNDDNIQQKLSKIQWFDQYNTFNYMVKIESIKMGDRILNREILNAQLAFDDSAVYFPEHIVEPIIRNMINSLCYNYRDESSLFYKLKEKICKNLKDMFYGESITITLSELNLVLHFLPDLIVNLYEESFKKSFSKKLTNYFKICPTNNSTILLNYTSNTSNSFQICSLVLISPRSNKIKLGTFFFENLYTSFDIQNGRVGFSEVYNCSSIEINTEESDLNFWIEIIYNFLIFLGIFLLVLISLNKCDNYFHDDYEIVIEEEEEEEESRDPTQIDN